MKKPLHILIDGADGLGKTTICQMLSRTLNLPVIKMPNMEEYLNKGTPEEFSKLFNETIIQFAEYDFIMDRGFTSSLVYSKVNNRKDDLSYISRIEQILDPEVFILVSRSHSVFADMNEMKERKFFRADKMFDRVLVEKIDDEFARIANEKYWSIQVNYKSPMEIVKFIISKLKE